jgi:hypothetical protein
MKSFWPPVSLLEPADFVYDGYRFSKGTLAEGFLPDSQLAVLSENDITREGYRRCISHEGLSKEGLGGWGRPVIL